MTSALDAYVAAAEAAGEDHRRTDPAWLIERRRYALERFRTIGFPTTRDEDWRFTSVASIAEGRFSLSNDSASSLRAGDLDPLRLPGESAATLVFVNGRYVATASDSSRLPAGVRIENLAQAFTDSADALEEGLSSVAAVDGHPFVALNTAFLLDGAVISVPDTIVVARPIHLLFVTTEGERSTMTQPRVLVEMGASSEASVVESYIGLGAQPYFTNAVTEIVASDNARLDHYTLQQESAESAHVGAIYVRAARDATVTCHSIALGGSLVRNDVVVVLAGEGATCTLNGLYVGNRHALVDNHTTIDHARPHCSSREIYKGILGDHARAVFNGKIVVRPDAQRTDAKQTNKALLLSNDAQINTKPQLEIFANDVKCTHGAAIGQMDDEAIFYLRARGLSEPEARRLLIRAFAGDVLQRLPLTALGKRLEQQLMARLPGGFA